MEFLEVPIFDDDLYKLLVRLAINLFFMILVVRLTVLPNQRDREFAFTAVMLNITVFFICFTLKKLELGLGMALGLFAIFGVLRYRTDTLRTKEMTYLFMLIGLAVINSLSNRKTSYVELAAVNSFILIAALINEAVLSRILSKDKTDEVAAEGDEAEDDVAATVWDVDPFGSGCIPSTPDHLPDGLWFGFAVGYDDGAVEFDLACVWGREELFEAGVIGEDEVFPNDYVLNDNPIIRTLETAVDGVGHLVDENAVSVEVNLQAEWGEAHTSWGGVECPSDLCYVSVLVEAGVIVELREIYQS